MGNTREKQLGALGFCAFSVPAILFLPQTGWETTLLVMSGSLLVVTCGRPVSGSLLGRGGKLLTLPLFLWNIGIMGKLASGLASLYGANSPLPGLLLLLLAGYGAKKKVIPVVSAVLVFFIAGIYGILYLFAIPDISVEELIPEKEGALWGTAYGFLPLLLLYLYQGKERKSRCFWMTGALILAVGAAVITEGLKAPDFYTGAKSVNLFGAMERLEPFVAAAVTAGEFCLFGMLIRVNETLWTGWGKEEKKYPLEGILVAAGALSVLIPGENERIWALGTTLCWGLVPIMTQLVVHEKKI